MPYYIMPWKRFVPVYPPKTWYLYDPRVYLNSFNRYLGGVRIVPPFHPLGIPNEYYVTMTEPQARYWYGLGVIGLVKFTTLPPKRQAIFRQWLRYIS